jgi:D-sedoheptulose 7-phosphate isomerase
MQIMSIDNIRYHFTEANKVLETFISKGRNFKNIYTAGNIMVVSLLAGKKIISCGNGGSMCDAMHFAEELSGKFREDRKPLPAIAISDPSYISCTANDFGYDKVFSRFIEAFGQKDDVLLAISTSGNSKNVIQAAKAAKNKGMHVIGLTGKDGGKLAKLCEVEIRAPHTEYADRTQEIHIKVIHALIDFIEINLAE